MKEEEQPTYTRFKCHCIDCDARFMICTEDEDISSEDVRCPMCGQADPPLYTWKETVKGYVSLDVPGQTPRAACTTRHIQLAAYENLRDIPYNKNN